VARSVGSPFRLGIVSLLLLQSVLAVVLFSPLLGYFMAQDDLILLHRANADPQKFLGSFFGHRPHHFRPLTKMVYFFLAYRAFGLNAWAYHLVSLLTHMANGLLVFFLFRRLRLTPAAGVVASTLFTLHALFFHLIAWACCIQYLAVLLFMLVSVLSAIEAMRRDSARLRVLSLGAYVLALCSLEQAVLLPLVLLAISLFGLAGPRIGWRGSIRLFWPHVVVLGLFVVFRFAWKPVPASGNYAIVWGQNVWANALTYCGAIFDIWGDATTGLSFTGIVTVSHVLLAALLAYNLVRRRYGQVAFAAIFCVGALAPVLPLRDHTHHLHLYVPAVGAFFLLALAVDDLLDLLRLDGAHREARRLLAAAVVVAAMVPFFYRAARANEYRTRPGSEARASFVLRRSMIAERTYLDLTRKAGDMAGVETVFMAPLPAVGHSPAGGGEMTLKFKEFRSAVKHKEGVQLFFGKFDLDVRFIPGRQAGGLAEMETTRLFFYDANGRCHTRRDLAGR